VKPGELVGYINGDGLIGLVLASWLEQHPGIGMTESWYEILWSDGSISEHVETKLEKINEAR